MKLMVALATIAVVAVGCTTAPEPLVHLAAPGAGPVTSVAADTVGPLRLRGADLVDAEGRVVLIHGVNSVAKSAPFVSPLEDGALGPADFAEFQREGINGVRLGVWPAALMPSPGVVDQDYLDLVARAVDELAAHHMWVLLDLHQDVFNGMPTWSTLPDAAALSDTPPELVSALIGWSAGYVSPRSLRQWDDWLNNAEVSPGVGVVDAYGAGLAQLAARFATQPNVVGIELINEPFPGTPILDCVTGNCPATDAKLAARSAEITNRIRAAATEMAVWWEPFTLSALFGRPDMAATGVTPTSTGPQVGLSFHAYCFETDAGTPVEPPLHEVALCNQVFGNDFGNADRLAAAWGGPRMLTEFGASKNPLNATLGARLADEGLMSWFHWGQYPDDAPDVVASQLVRTFAQAVAGSPISQRFDPATGNFELSFTPDASVAAPTTIAVPAQVYPGGYVATVAGGSVTSAANSGRLTVVSSPGAATVTVRVTRG